MPAPNLRDPATVTGKTAVYVVTNAMGTVLSNPGASGKVMRVNSVYCANIDANLLDEITLVLTRGGVNYRLASAMTVPARATQVLVAREAYIYLEEGDSLQAQALTNNRFEIVVGYEEIA
jgi:hypothetical protein